MNDYNLIYTNTWPFPAAVSTKGVATSSIRKITVSDTNQMFEDQFQWLKNAVETSKTAKNVVVTHHLPSLDLNPPEYKGNEVNAAFATHLNKFIEEHPQINAWVCGHSHGVQQMKIGSTNCYMHCIGYFFEAKGRSYNCTFTV